MNRFPEEYKISDGIFFPSKTEGQEDFLYSDGEDFERSIGEIISNAKDKSLFSRELASAGWDWRSSCHLSPVRANILRPLEEKCRGRVLELGSGCGIITRYLGELGAQVTALEASDTRASITRKRTEDLENVKVICDRIEDFHSDEKFDVVTLIGVLQYARIFSKCGADAELRFLENATRQLDEHGVVVIAIQNRLGLKYFAGYPEANVGVPYYGIEGSYGDETIVRFGYKEVKDLLCSVGLTNHEILLPLPDYHMPVSVLSPDAIRKNPKFSPSPLLTATVGRDRVRPDWRTPSFSLERAWESISKSGLEGDLSNAFLIVAGKTEESLRFLRNTDTLAWHFSVERHPHYATSKRFTGENGQISVHRDSIVSGSDAPVFESPIVHHVEQEEFHDGQLWWSGLVEIVNTPGWSMDGIGKWAKEWILSLGAAANTPRGQLPELSMHVDGRFFDCSPMNCISANDGSLGFFDMEWEVKSPLRLSYVVVRGLFGSLVGISSCAAPVNGTSLNIVDLIKGSLSTLGLVLSNSDIEDFIENEAKIQGWINRGSEGEVSELWADYVRNVQLDARCPLSKETFQEQQREIDRLHGLIEQEKRNVLSYSNSFSWRVTKPLRFVARHIRALRGA